MNTDSCDMVRVSDTLADHGEMPIGGYCFKTMREGHRVMWVSIPPGTTIVLRLRPYPGPESSWQWDGNEDKPTLTPSVHAVGCWHGFIKAGRLESCQ